MRAAVTLLVLAASAAPAAAEPVRPLGALGVGGELALTGPGPARRATAEATLYVTRRFGGYLAARHVTLSPLADAGQVTAGVAFRAAAARPRLEVVMHGDAGVAWPLAPSAGGGVTAYLWPLTRVPVALTTGTSAYLVLDSDDTRLVLSLGLGLALAR